MAEKVVEIFDELAHGKYMWRGRMRAHLHGNRVTVDEAWELYRMTERARVAAYTGDRDQHMRLSIMLHEIYSYIMWTQREEGEAVSYDTQ